MKQHDWSPDDRYRSNGGTGPLTARITHVVDGQVHGLRWKGEREPVGTGRHSVLFSLPAEFFFESPSCGWRKVER